MRIWGLADEVFQGTCPYPCLSQPQADLFSNAYELDLASIPSLQPAHEDAFSFNIRSIL